MFAALAAPAAAGATPASIRCPDLATADLAIDGLLDDWPKQVQLRAGVAPDNEVAVRCAWDGGALAIALDIADDRVIRLARGGGHEDRVEIAVAAAGKPARAVVFPGNALAKPRHTLAPKVRAADSLQPRGFSVEVVFPAAALAGFSASTPALAVTILYDDADRATGGDTTRVEIPLAIELGDRKDLLDDLLRATRLRKADLRFDRMAELDPDRRGHERVVAGGTVIAVLTDQFAFVTLPAARPGDVRKVELLPLGARGRQVIAATVRQAGGGGSRDLLMLWTVWSGQLQPLAQIEVRKEHGANVLESTWKLVASKRGPELWVQPGAAVGFSAATWNEEPAADADPIALPWDRRTGGTAYTLTGMELARRDLPPAKPRR